MNRNLLVSLLFVPGLLLAANKYYQRNLVADLPGVADQVDPLLKNPWGICTSAASPFWTSNQGSGTSTVYNSFGVPNATLKPVVPATSAGAAPGKPTGCVNNSTATAFFVPNSGGRTASFLFATENGSISGWANAVNPAQAIVMIDNSQSGAVYKGLALAIPSADIGPRIYAANFGNRRVEIYDKNWQPVYYPGAFQDLDLPSDYAPFNVEALGGKLYVTFAKQNDAKNHDVPGPGNGYVNVYDLNGSLLSRLVAGGNLNSPWGLAIAPAAFGDLAGTLLVGNFGDGRINAYNVTTGAFMAALQNKDGDPISIPGLWGLRLGNGGNGGNVNTIYFSAGPGAEQHGLFGSLQPAPAVKDSGGIENAASFAATIAPGGFASVFGTNLAATQRTWADRDIVSGKLPTSLDGVSVTVGGKPAYIYFISPGQINLIVPDVSPLGSLPVVVTNNGLIGPPSPAAVAAYSPGFFISKNNNVIATHANGTLVGATTLYPNNSTPAKQGETIELWMTGLGATNPLSDGVVVPSPIPTASQPTVTIGGVGAQVVSSVLSGPGLYQVNVTVGQGTPSGDQAIVLSIGGTQTQAGALLAVAAQ
jgi:uncharacterized protein (TIGR03118 family)